MSQATGFNVTAGWQVLLKDIGIRPADVLRRAGLPDDLFSRDGAVLSVGEYFDLWRGIEAEANDPLLHCGLDKRSRSKPSIHRYLRPCVAPI